MSLDEGYEDYNMHVVKYACGKHGPNFDPETGCEPMIRHNGELILGERCFCEGDRCFNPEGDEKYMARALANRKPLYVDIDSFSKEKRKIPES